VWDAVDFLILILLQCESISVHCKHNMAPRLGERCENCFKHLRLGHLEGASCEMCLPSDGTLRRCNSCQIVRYCARECQKAHWKDHKPFCRVNVSIKRGREQMGTVVAERQRTFEKWCEHHSQHMSSAAVSALELMRDRERTDTHVFLVYVDVIEHISTQASSKPRFVRSVRDARCTALSEVHQMFDSRFIEGYATLERSLAPHPRLLRILVVDDGLPVPLDLYTLPTDVGGDVSAVPFDPDWFVHLKLLVDGV